MDPKKILQKPSLAYTSNPNYRKPPKTPNPVSIVPFILILYYYKLLNSNKILTKLESFIKPKLYINAIFILVFTMPGNATYRLVQLYGPRRVKSCNSRSYTR